MIFYKNVVVILITIVTCSELTISVQWLNLSPLEYEKCDFHIFDLYIENTITTDDLIENIVVSNQGSQLWTITKQLIWTKDSSIVAPTGIPKNWQETCSVNMLVAVELEECFEKCFFDIFLSRVFSAENKFLLLFNASSVCKMHSIVQDTTRYLIVPDVYFVYLNSRPGKFGSISRDEYEVKAAHSFCPTCYTEYKNVSLMTPLQPLNEISKFSNKFTANSIESVVYVISKASAGAEFDPATAAAFSFLYPHRRNTISVKVGYSVEHILMENIAANLNLTVVYISPLVAQSKGYYWLEAHRKCYGVAVGGLISLIAHDYYSTDNIASQFLRKKNEISFLVLHENQRA